MDAFKEFDLIALDTPVFVYEFEENPQFTPLTGQVFKLHDEGRISIVTSVITLTEVLIKPFKYGNDDLISDYSDLLFSYERLTTYEISAEIAIEAARLRGVYGFRLPDALQVATAIWTGAKAFLTNDARLKGVKEIKVLCLSDFV